jgi:outer membrane protein OmpA-like peptidoglycan-associated protein/tetratricopeptide (TPR) repeat protein
LLLIILVQFVSAQKYQTPSRSPKTEAKIADKFFAESNYYSAIEYYKDVVRQQPDNRYASYWLAVAYLYARDYHLAEVFFDKFSKIRPSAKANTKKWEKEDQILFDKFHYLYGQVLHRNGKNDEAIEHLNKFLKAYEPKDENDQLKTFAKLELQGAEFAKTAPRAKVKVKWTGPTINRSYTEASPVCVGDSVLYYSSIKIAALSSKVDTLIFYNGSKSKREYQIMKSVREGAEWGKGKPIKNEDINQEGYIVGNGAFNSDMTRFYFTKCLEMDDDRSLCNLFVANHDKGKFSKIERLPDPINSKEAYTSTHPTVRTSEDGLEIVYFSSDMPGGKGGNDLWYCIRSKGGDYKGPKHLKGPVNTVADEVTPYFDDSTKILYFSSNGHPGFGGFDVFGTKESEDLGWDSVTNIGSPLNTGVDELYYTRSKDETYGYLTSNREGSVPLNGIKTASDDIFYWTNFNYGVQGIVFKEGDNEGGGMVGAKFNLYKKNEDGTKTLVGIDSTSRDGYYFFKLGPDADYTVEVVRPGFSSKFEDITTKGLADEDTLQQNLTMRKGVVIGWGEITQQGKPEVKISGANVTLIEVSPNGAEKTVYYEKRPDNSPAYYFELANNKKYKVNVKREGFFANTVVVNTSGLAVNQDSLRVDVQLTKLELNTEYTLQNVLYEFGKATLTESSKSVMDTLYNLMAENPSFVIELSAHTDGIGSDAANLKLSQARAESCVKYLIGRGIAKERLVAVGYGETKPKVPNTNAEGKDDPTGRAINRRTEFKILKN